MYELIEDNNFDLVGLGLEVFGVGACGVRVRIIE